MPPHDELDAALREIVVLQLQCSAVLLVDEDYQSCVRKRGHEGQHRTLSGETWSD